MPLLDRLIGNDWQLDLVGDCAPGLRAELESPRVRVHGRVEDLTAHYEGARLFIAPTRFAAGIPHKAHEAAARGLPMVATRLIAGQLGWKEGAALLAADSPDEFAQACAQLYRNCKLWERVRTDSLAKVARDCDPEAFRRVVRRVLEPAVRQHPLKMRFRALP
ncbi:MAG TPA: glycosyltransferase family 4 protein [Variovorax sp.]|nr:glycosyltransferase family 4 protein [Variovorax sp.]